MENVEFEFLFDILLNSWSFDQTKECYWVERIKLLNIENKSDAIESFKTFLKKQDDCAYSIQESFELDDYEDIFGKEALNELYAQIDLYQDDVLIYTHKL
jgi:hypothetical protein